MNTIPSIAIRLAEIHLADIGANHAVGDYAAALAAARKLIKDAEGLVMFMEQLTQPAPGLHVSHDDVLRDIEQLSHQTPPTSSTPNENCHLPASRLDEAQTARIQAQARRLHKHQEEMRRAAGHEITQLEDTTRSPAMPYTIQRLVDRSGCIAINGLRYDCHRPAGQEIEITVTPAGPIDSSGCPLLPVSYPGAGE